MGRIWLNSHQFQPLDEEWQIKRKEEERNKES
jgi:hypothetical protein